MTMIAVEIEFAPGLTRRDYEAVLEGLGLDEDPPPGLLSHLATEREGRIRVIEVWRSGREYRIYRHSRLMPNIEYALGPERAALSGHSIRTRLPVRGIVVPAPARSDPVHLEDVRA